MTYDSAGKFELKVGGHVAQFLAMRPRDPRYNAIPWPSVAKPGPQTDRARKMVKQFIARQLET